MPRPRRSEDLIVSVARMRYEQRLPQTEIARQLDLSEATVSRCLKAALDLGYVEIQVAPKAFRDAEAEQRLKKAFGLAHAVVVEDRPGHGAGLDVLAKATARLLEDLLDTGDVLGVSDGITVAAIAQAMRRPAARDLDVVSLVGGVGAPEEPSHSSEVCRRAAAGLGARGWQLPVPAIVDDVAIATVLHDTAAVRAVFDLMRRVRVALVGVGTVSRDATIFRHGLVDESLAETIRANGAAGTICARFFGPGGQPVGTGFDDRTLSISLTDLARVEIRLGAARSPGKAPAIRAAIEGGLLNAIATDGPTAEALLSLA
ncbi:sugar-binding transcriptional regulator [Chthonobacter rhizosphaerae]|uniref:sugar-binding transcriptional regulator n=1 Tax=Chthonobacter rhizosphaerae TaxID=2735553 RepID=UPI0015EE5A57|nr:sugar-binding domain-containing protein [Chthonobacter rhizosphaerae]